MALGDFGLGVPSETAATPTPAPRVSALQQAISKVPAQPTYGGTLKKSLTNSRGGALAAAIGTIGSFAVGGVQGGTGFLSGYDQAIQEKVVEQQQTRADALKAVQDQIDHEEKIRTSMVTLLQTQPEMFANLSPAEVGDLVAPGLGLELSPGAKLQESKFSEQRKQNMDVIKSLWQDAATPEAKKTVGSLMARAAGWKIGGEDGLPEDLFNQFWQQDGEFTDEQLAANFGMTGVEAAAIRARTGELPYHILKPLPGKDEKIDLAAKSFDLLQKAQTYSNQQMLEGKNVPLPVAISQVLTEAEQAILRKEIPEVYGPNVQFDDALRIYASIFQSMGALGLARTGMFQGNVEENLRRVTSDALSSAGELSRINLDRDYTEAVKIIQRRIIAQASADGREMSLSEITKKAIAVVNAQWNAEGKQIPSNKQQKPTASSVIPAPQEVKADSTKP